MAAKREKARPFLCSERMSMEEVLLLSHDTRAIQPAT